MSNHSIDLDKLVLPAYHDFFQDKSYYSILYGGRGSGKSRAIAQKIVFRCLSERNHLWVVLRETKGSHTDSTFRELKAVIEQFGVFPVAEFYSSPIKIKFPSVNSEILFLGMDDEQHLKSLSGVTGLWWEEISQIKSQEKFEEVLAGFRPDKGHYEQIHMSFNPVSKEHWIKARFFDPNPDSVRTFIKRTTYLDNKHLNRNTVQTYLNLKYTNEYLYKVNVLGEWGTIPSGNEFYKGFSYAQNVDSNNDVTYNPNLPLHISFDFNVIPHMTLVLFQIINKTVYVIDEITAASPANTIEGICRKFMQKYDQHITGLFVYGDPSGNNRNAVVANQTFFKLIQQQLSDFNPVMRATKVFPSVAVRAQWINQILSTQYNGINIKINSKCQGLIRDMIEMKEDENGHKVKDVAYADKMGKYEKYGHFSDALDYFLTECFKMDWLAFSKRGRSNNFKMVIPTRSQRAFRY